MRLVVLYIILVGLPVVGVWTILRAGQSLVAPRAVSGTWQLDAPGDDSPAAECLRARMGSDRMSLIVSQSGPGLQAVLEGGQQLALRGSIQGDRLQFESEGPQLSAAGSAGVTLRATVGSGGLPELTGVLDVGCGTVVVSGIRGNEDEIR